MDRVNVDAVDLPPAVGGFELALRSEWVPRLMAGIDEAVRIRELPYKRFTDVGRFPIVFDGRAFGDLVAQTASLALDAERAVGLEADASGTSYLSPPDEILSAANPQYSPLLTLQSSRMLPSTTAAGWDDEGVVPEAYMLIEKGRVVNYHTTRETTSYLAHWYRTHHRPLRPHGTVVASTAASVPVGTAGHLTVPAWTERATIDDLAKDIQHGFIVQDGYANTDTGLSGGTFSGYTVLEVIKGKCVARTGILIQFTTKTLLAKQLVALGDHSTMRTHSSSLNKGIPWQGFQQPITAPAALIKDVDVVVWDLTP